MSDWRCPVCGFQANPDYVDCCQQCGEPRPDSETGPLIAPVQQHIPYYDQAIDGNTHSHTTRDEAQCCCCDEDGCCGANGPDCSDPTVLAGICCCLVCVCIALAIGLAISANSIKPTEFGLHQDGITGVVNTKTVLGPGTRFISPFDSYVTFPSTTVTLEFSYGSETVSAPVNARTGGDENDPNSGGQPVAISFSLQYQIPKDHVGKLYDEFGTQYEQTLILEARKCISDTSQRLSPSSFWEKRSLASKMMFQDLKRKLQQRAKIDVVGFQLLRVDFPLSYEKMITSIQLQEQEKLTSEYQQHVTIVIKDIDVLSAETHAQVAAVNAGASATSALMINAAKAKGFYLQQRSKAESYAELKSMLQLSNDEILDYVKIKALTGDGRSSNTVVGAAAPALVSA